MDRGTLGRSFRAGARTLGGRVGRRIAGTALVAAVLVGLAPGVATAAPGDDEIAAAQAAADEVAARIAELSGRLTTAEETVDAARAGALIALDEYQATQAAHQAARTRAEQAAADATRATAELGVAREELVAFARRSYMDGSSYPGAAALITAGSPAELIERAALLEAAGSHRSDVLVHVAGLQEVAVRAEAVARTTLAEADALQQEAAGALAIARDAEISARAQAAALEAEQATLQTELAAAEEELQALVGERAAAEATAQVVPARTEPSGPPPAAPVRSGNQAPAGSGSASAAQTAVDAALAYVGITYAWGGGGSAGPGPGSDPDEGIVGFDCSGLTQYAYARAGISIPRNSRAQYSALPKVAAGDLRAGDLVFWASNPSDPSTIHHVALYLGDGRIVHAPESGDVVKVADLRWRGYAGAVRPSA